MNCISCPAFSKSIFQELNQEALDKLEREKVLLSLASGEHVFQDNESADYIYCLMDCFCKITQKRDQAEKETIIRIAGAGDIAGHRSIFHRERYLGNASLLEGGNLCRISKKTIFELIQSEPKFALTMLKKLSIDISAADERVHSFNKLSVRERLVKVLLQLTSDHGITHAEGNMKFKLKLHRKELASLVSASTENVVRLLSEFKTNKAIIETDGGETIVDTERLKEMVNNKSETSDDN